MHGLGSDRRNNLNRVLGWSAFTAVAVTVVVYLLNYPLAKYDLFVRVASLISRLGDWLTPQRE